MNRIIIFEDKAGSGYKAHKSYGNAFLVGFLFGVGSIHLQGVLHSSSRPDYIEDKKSGGQQQSNLFSASAGSDLRMSTMRPNPYLSAEVKMRKSKFRGFFQLFSRPN